MWKGNQEFKKEGGTDEDCVRMAEENDEQLAGKCLLSAGASGKPATASKIALYHYATKSLQDFSEKMNRGSGMSKRSKGMDYFAEISRYTHFFHCSVAVLLTWGQCVVQHITACSHSYARYLNVVTADVTTVAFMSMYIRSLPSVQEETAQLFWQVSS
jgi:hypothetical protein